MALPANYGAWRDTPALFANTTPRTARARNERRGLNR